MALPYTDAPFFVKLYQYFINSVFPSECLHCSREGEWLCNTCLEATPKILALTCPFCNRLSREGQTCSRCRKKHPNLRGGRAIWYYELAIISLIRHYKYHHITASLDFIVPHVKKSLDQIIALQRGTVILTSVPSSRPRVSRYGYNQSELLALAIADASGLPYFPLLRRLGNRGSQTKLSRQERFLAVENQFIPAKNRTLPPGVSVIILDDVLTTGATLEACAKALRKAGAKSVWALTIAKD